MNCWIHIHGGEVETLCTKIKTKKKKEMSFQFVQLGLTSAVDENVAAL